MATEHWAWKGNIFFLHKSGNTTQSGVFAALNSTWYLASRATLISGPGPPYILPPTSYTLHWQLPKEVSHFHIRLSPMP